MTQKNKKNKDKAIRGLKLGKTLKQIRKRTGFSFDEIRGFQTELLRDREGFLQDSVLEMTELFEIAKMAYKTRPNGGTGSIVAEFIRLRANLVDMFNSLVDTSEYYEAIDYGVLVPFQRSILRVFIDGMKGFLDDLERDVASDTIRRRLRENLEDIMRQFSTSMEEVYEESLDKTASVLGIEAVTKKSHMLTTEVTKARHKKTELRVINGSRGGL